MKLSVGVLAAAAFSVLWGSAAAQGPSGPSDHLREIMDFITKHEGDGSEVKPASFSVLHAWEELLDEHGPELLIERIKNYKSAAPSFPGTIIKQKGAFSTFSDIEVGRNQDNPHQFSTVALSQFDDHRLRIKASQPELLNLDSVDQYTGYLDIDSEDKHLFFWFFESRNDPATDPIILWLNGGPGCSSSTGLFFELGPSSIGPDILPVYNPHSWNSNASVIFLDQPAGVGYSYLGPDAKSVTSTAAASKDVLAFLELFFHRFPQFKSNKFHIAGESYAGHYIPKFASDIVKAPQKSFELSSVLIGNGIFDPIVQIPTFRSMLCGEGGLEQLISDEHCAEMDKDFTQCYPLAKACYALQNAFACVPAKLVCDKIRAFVWETERNPYDLTKPCIGSSLCYVELEYMDKFLDSEYVKYVLGVDPRVGQFQSCSDDVSNGFDFTGDYMLPHQQYVAELLEAGVPVLLYAGDKDFNCNWLGNSRWSDLLPYSKHEQYASAPTKPFLTNGGSEQHGTVKNFEIFTFIRVFNSGHLVPYDKPEVSLEMLNRWVAGDYGFEGK